MAGENENTQQDQDAAGKTGDSNTDGFKPITSQEEFNRILAQRLERERSKFADYDDLKAKASKYDKVVESQKTAEQRLQEQLQQAERRAQEAERTALRVRIATEFGVPQEAVHGDDEASMRTTAQKLVEWRDSNKRPVPTPKSLKSGSAGERDEGGSRAAAALRAMRGANH